MKMSGSKRISALFLVTIILALAFSAVMTPVMASPTVADPNYGLEVFAKDLDGPFGLAFDKDGNLYVANEGKGGGGGTTISKITPDGQVSTYATGFEGPSGLAFDKDGNLWVSDDQHPINIWKIAPDGSITPGSNFEFGNPNAIAFDKDWNLFVADARSGYIYKISPDGTVSPFVGPFEGPQAVAFDMSGNIYTSDGGGRIYKIDPYTGSVNVFSEGILKSTQGGLAFDDEGNLYASEFWPDGLQNVYVFTPDGEGKPFITGFDPADFNFPRGLIFDNMGRLYVTEYGTGMIWRVMVPTFLKVAELLSTEDGNMYVERLEEAVWNFKIRVTNTFDLKMTDIVVEDNFGGELELGSTEPCGLGSSSDVDLVEEDYLVEMSQGEFSYKLKGRTKKVSFTWTITNIPCQGLAPGDSATLVLRISTDVNPKGIHEYATIKTFEMNSGANLKFKIGGEQHSMVTDPLYVDVYHIGVPVEVSFSGRARGPGVVVPWPGQYFRDDFDNPDYTKWQWTNASGTWVTESEGMEEVKPGEWKEIFVYSQDEDGTNKVAYVNVLKFRDGDIKARIKSVDGKSGQHIIWRSDGGAASNYYLFGWNFDPDFLRWGKFVDGTFHEKGRIDRDFDAGKWYELYVHVEGSDFEMYLDNELIFNVTDTEITDFGFAGLHVGYHTHVDWFEISVIPVMYSADGSISTKGKAIAVGIETPMTMPSPPDVDWYLASPGNIEASGSLKAGWTDDDCISHKLSIEFIAADSAYGMFAPYVNWFQLMGEAMGVALNYEGTYDGRTVKGDAFMLFFSPMPPGMTVPIAAMMLILEDEPLAIGWLSEETEMLPGIEPATSFTTKVSVAYLEYE